jgi:hypothetical protein
MSLVMQFVMALHRKQDEESIAMVVSPLLKLLIDAQASQLALKVLLLLQTIPAEAIPVRFNVH